MQEEVEKKEVKISEGKYQWKNVGHQYFAAIIANLIMVGHGTINGWLSPVLPLLLSEDTPLQSGPFTNAQLSWIGSIISVGGMIGPFISGFLISIMGCKRTMFLLVLPNSTFWALIYFGTTFDYILVALFLAGISGSGILTCVVLYVSEIANDNIRGRLGSFLYLSRNIGILITFVVGALVNYKSMPFIFVTIPISFIVIFTFLPNTPQFHMQRHQLEKAESSLKYYKGYKGDSIEESCAINNEFHRLKVIATQNKDKDKVGLKDLCEREAIKGLSVGVILGFLTQLTGNYSFISYAVLIFERSGSDIDPYLSSIIMAVLQIFGNLCTTQLVESLGRKILMIISLAGNAGGLIVLALFMYLNQNGFDMSAFSWVPVSCLSFSIFISSAGIISLGSVCAIEHLPTKVRTTGTAIYAICVNFSSFLCTKYFPILMEVIDLHGCLLIFAAFSILGSLYVLLFISETKGKTLDVVKTEEK